MDPSCILMCANIPRGIPEEVLVELFCIVRKYDNSKLNTEQLHCFQFISEPAGVKFTQLRMNYLQRTVISEISLIMIVYFGRLVL